MISASGYGPQMTSQLISRTSPIVFVVDDDISIRESLETLIRLEGLDVQTFTSAQEFLAHPRTSVPSCIVLDVSLRA
jgi:FixJ family two-component response regulator